MESRLHPSFIAEAKRELRRRGCLGETRRQLIGALAHAAKQEEFANVSVTVDQPHVLDCIEPFVSQPGVRQSTGRSSWPEARVRAINTEQPKAGQARQFVALLADAARTPGVITIELRRNRGAAWVSSVTTPLEPSRPLETRDLKRRKAKAYNELETLLRRLIAEYAEPSGHPGWLGADPRADLFLWAETLSPHVPEEEQKALARGVRAVARVLSAIEERLELTSQLK